MAARPPEVNDKEAPAHNDTNGTGAPAMRQMTSESVAIPKDVYESMYLNPASRVKGQLRKTFANPTPL